MYLNCSTPLGKHVASHLRGVMLRHLQVAPRYGEDTTMLQLAMVRRFLQRYFLQPMFWRHMKKRIIVPPHQIRLGSAIKGSGVGCSSIGQKQERRIVSGWFHLI